MTDYHQYLLTKAQQYCSYQERSLYELNKKLIEWKAQPNVAEKIISHLTKNDYINEERFASEYALGKFRQKKWGKNKIIFELKMKHIPDLYIQIGVESIPEDEYRNALNHLLKKKIQDYKETDIHKRNYKIASFAVNKGFRSELVWDVINNEL